LILILIFWDLDFGQDFLDLVEFIEEDDRVPGAKEDDVVVPVDQDLSVVGSDHGGRDRILFLKPRDLDDGGKESIKLEGLDHERILRRWRSDLDLLDVVLEDPVDFLVRNLSD
jgi:hypothetical protein